MADAPTLVELVAGMPGTDVPPEIDFGPKYQLDAQFLNESAWPILGNEAPLRGMRSAVDASVLQPGEHALVQNVRGRVGQEVAQVRWGDATFLPGVGANTLALRLAGLATPEYRGSGWDPLTGIVYLAVTDNTRTVILWYSPSNDGWYFLTSAAGMYGDTRFPSNSKPVSFAIVRDTVFAGTVPFASPVPVNRVVAMMDLAGELPRVCACVDDATVTCARHKNVPAPQASMSWSWAIPAAYWTINTLVVGNMVNTGANIIASVGGVAGVEQWLNIAIGAGTIAGDAGGFNGLTAIEANLYQEFHLVYACDDEYPWENLAIEFWNGAGWVEVYSPTSAPTLAYPIVHSVDDEYRFASFVLNKGIVLSAATFTGFRVQWKGAMTTPAITLKVYFAGFALGRPGGATFATSFFHSMSRVESPSTVCLDKGGIPIWKVGGTKITGLNYPVYSDCRYTYQVFCNQLRGAIITDAAAPGTDYILTYCKDVGGTDFRLLADTYYAGALDSGYQECAVYAAGWIRPTGIATAFNQEINNPLDDQYRSRMVLDNPLLPRNAPDGVNEGIPPGSGLGVLNQRLLVARAQLTNGSNNDACVAVSDAQNPFRFRFDLRVRDGKFDSLSPTVMTFADENVQGIRVASEGSLGSDSVFVATDRGLWAAGGFDAYQLSRPQRRSNHGTLSPRSMTVYRGSLIYVDANRQVRMSAGGDQLLTENNVEDLLRLVPDARIDDICADVFNDVLYVAITPTGLTSNRTVLVLDFKTQGWVVDSYTSLSIEGFLPQHRSLGDKLAYFTQGGVMMEKERSGQQTDAGTAITMAIRSREVRGGANARIQVGRVYCTIDKQTAPKFLSVRRYKKSDATAPVVSYIDCSGDASDTVVSKVDAAKTAGGDPYSIGAIDLGIQVDVRGDLNGGTKIYDIWADVIGLEGLPKTGGVP